MLLFLDSFDHYAFADITTKWTQSDGGSGDISTIAAVGRRSTNALQLAESSGNRVSIRMSLVPSMPAPSGATFISGMAFRCVSPFATERSNTDSENTGSGAAPVLWAIRSATSTLCWVRLNTNGTISVYRGTTLLGTSSAALSQNVYHFIECKIVLHASTGTVTLRIDGATVLSLTGQNTGGTSWDEVRIGGTTSFTTTATEWDIDDFYLADGSGSDGWADLMGDLRIDATFPNAAGSLSDFTRSTGSDQWATIDEASANGDTDYNSSGSIGDIDTLNFPNAPASGAPIRGIQLVVQARKEDAGAAGHKADVKISGVDYQGTERSPAETYSFLRECWGKNPANSSAWTDTVYNAAEFGYTKSL